MQDSYHSPPRAFAAREHKSPTRQTLPAWGEITFAVPPCFAADAASAASFPDNAGRASGSRRMAQGCPRAAAAGSFQPGLPLFQARRRASFPSLPVYTLFIVPASAFLVNPFRRGFPGTPPDPWRTRPRRSSPRRRSAAGRAASGA